MTTDEPIFRTVIETPPIFYCLDNCNRLLVDLLSLMLSSQLVFFLQRATRVILLKHKSEKKITKNKTQIWLCPIWCSVAQSCLTLCSPMAVAHQAPLLMEFSRQKYWSGLPFLTPYALLTPVQSLQTFAILLDLPRSLPHPARFCIILPSAAILTSPPITLPLFLFVMPPRAPVS